MCMYMYMLFRMYADIHTCTCGVSPGSKVSPEHCERFAHPGDRGYRRGEAAERPSVSGYPGGGGGGRGGGVVVRVLVSL